MFLQTGGANLQVPRRHKMFIAVRTSFLRYVRYRMFPY